MTRYGKPCELEKEKLVVVPKLKQKNQVFI